jgi:hypothetical protein
MGRISSLPLSLIRPDRAFSGEGIYRIPKYLLVLLLFLLYVVGSRLSAGYDQNSHAKQLALTEADSRMGTFIANAPPEEQARARDRMVGSILGNQSGLFVAVGVVFSGLFFLLLVIEMWLVCRIVTQFFGGQEERHGPDRPSLTLFLVSFIPLGLRKVAEGLVLSTRTSEAASNALTLTEYRAASAVHFDLYSLLAPAGLPGLLTAVGRTLTDPFFLWTLALLVFGGRLIFRIPLKSAVGQTLILVALMALQTVLLKSIGLTVEI